MRPSPARSPGPTSIPGRSAAAGLVEAAFDELAKRWRPILDAFDAAGVDCRFEIHPGEDLHDGATFEMFLDEGRQSPTLQHPLRSQPLRAATAGLPRVSSTSTTTASRCFTSRTPSSIRAAGRASTAASSRGSIAPDDSARSATARSTSDRHLLQADPVRVRRLGRARMGMLYQERRTGRGRRGALHQAAHHRGDGVAPSTIS